MKLALFALVPWIYLFCFYGQQLTEPSHPVLGAAWGFVWLLGPSFLLLRRHNPQAFVPCLLAAIGFFAPYFLGWAAWAIAQLISAKFFGKIFYLGRGIS
jgi:hypothetical protein